MYKTKVAEAKTTYIGMQKIPGRHANRYNDNDKIEKNYAIMIKINKQLKQMDANSSERPLLSVDGEALLYMGCCIPSLPSTELM